MSNNSAAVKVPEIIESAKRSCSVPGCDRRHKAKNYCHGHYERYLKGERGDQLNKLLGPRRGWSGRERLVSYTPPKTECLAPGCPKRAKAKGYCKGHWERWHKGIRGEELNKPLRFLERHPPLAIVKASMAQIVEARPRKPGPQPHNGCQVEGCERKHAGKGFCGAHLLRWNKGLRGKDLTAPIRRTGSFLAGNNLKAPKESKGAYLDRQFFAACLVNATDAESVMAEFKAEYARKVFNRVSNSLGR